MGGNAQVQASHRSAALTLPVRKGLTSADPTWPYRSRDAMHAALAGMRQGGATPPPPLLNEPVTTQPARHGQAVAAAVAAEDSLLMQAMQPPHAANAALLDVLLSSGADPNLPNADPNLRWACLTSQQARRRMWRRCYCSMGRACPAGAGTAAAPCT